MRTWLARNLLVTGVVVSIAIAAAPPARVAAAAATATAAQRPAEVDPELRRRLQAAAAEADSFRDRFEAQVWLVDMAQRLERRLPDLDERLELLKLVHAEASRVALPPELVLSVIDVESNFDRYAISSAGARGLMQIMPFWLDEIGRPDDNLFKVHTNLRFGCTILRYYYDLENGNLGRALARYNGSLGRRTYVDRVFTRWRTRWERL